MPMENLSSTENKARLLILTQVIDLNDGVLGFFHGWVEKFAQVFPKITAICLKKGTHTLPQNVSVFSLGKEQKESRILYILNFYKIIWAQRNDYDVVFVHMNKEYVLLGALLWRLWGKKIVLWYNHPIATVSAQIAAQLAHQVLYTSPSSYFGRHGIGKRMSVGIDTDIFTIEGRYPRSHTIISLGRIAPVKNTLLLVQAFAELLKNGVTAHLILAGDALPQDSEYKAKVDEVITPIKEHVTITGTVPYHTVPQLFKSADIFVNLTPSGSLDKTIFEAMAAGCIVVSANDYVTSLLPENVRNNLFVPVSENQDISKITEALDFALNLSDSERESLQKTMRDTVVQDHSLERLTRDIAEVIRGVY